jgi:hypothetical protein
VNEQTELQTTFQAALESVKSDPDHNLDPRKRIELYTLFCEYDEDKHLGHIAPVRGYLALKTARRVVHLWEDLSDQLYYHYLQCGKGVEVDERPISDPQRMHRIILMMCEDILAGKADMQEVNRVVDFLYYRMDGLTYLIYELLEENAIPLGSENARLYWNAFSGLQACRQVLREVRGIFDIPIYTNSGTFPFILEDAAYFAMRAECGDVAEKRLVFWTWWLTEAIPQVWEQVHGAGY